MAAAREFKIPALASAATDSENEREEVAPTIACGGAGAGRGGGKWVGGLTKFKGGWLLL